MLQPATPRQEVKSYRPGMFRSSYRKYEHDLKRRATQGWRLVSCTEAGRDIFLRVWLTDTYERSWYGRGVTFRSFHALVASPYRAPLLDADAGSSKPFNFPFQALDS